MMQINASTKKINDLRILLPKLTFRTGTYGNIQVTFDDTVVKKYNVSFGQILRMNGVYHIVIGEANNILYFSVQGLNGLRYWNDVDAHSIKQNFTPVNAPSEYIEKVLKEIFIKCSDYTHMTKMIKQKENALRLSQAKSAVLSEEQKKLSATKYLQSFFRLRPEIKKYGFKQLRYPMLQDIKALVVGSDPRAPDTLDQYHEPNDKIALIGTSALRSVSFACKLGNKNIIPKIIIVDFSKNVYKFWDHIRDFVTDDKKAGNEVLFFQNLNKFLNDNKDFYGQYKIDIIKQLYKVNPNCLPQDIPAFFKALFKKYSYDFVKKVIGHVSIIRQDWRDQDTFIKIKNILDYLEIKKVYVYASNIVASIDDNEIRLKILENIKLLNPVISIHSDFLTVSANGNTGGIPVKLYMFDDNDPKKVAETINAGNSVKM